VKERIPTTARTMTASTMPRRTTGFGRLVSVVGMKLKCQYIRRSSTLNEAEDFFSDKRTCSGTPVLL
jgi:hypothetical protein